MQVGAIMRGISDLAVKTAGLPDWFNLPGRYLLTRRGLRQTRRRAIPRDDPSERGSKLSLAFCVQLTPSALKARTGMICRER